MPSQQTQVLLLNPPRKQIQFLKLRSSSLAPCPFMSAFRAQIWSGKSITVIKWASSKHPSRGTTPLPGPVRPRGWISALGLIKTHRFSGVYILRDNRWYLDNVSLYVRTCVQHPLYSTIIFIKPNLCIYCKTSGVCLCGTGLI